MAKKRYISNIITHSAGVILRAVLFYRRIFMYSIISNIACFFLGGILGVCAVCTMQLANSLMNEAEQNSTQEQEDNTCD